MLRSILGEPLYKGTPKISPLGEAYSTEMLKLEEGSRLSDPVYDLANQKRERFSGYNAADAIPHVWVGRIAKMDVAVKEWVLFFLTLSLTTI